MQIIFLNTQKLIISVEPLEVVINVGSN